MNPPSIALFAQIIKTEGAEGGILFSSISICHERLGLMEKFLMLTEALDYIEENLENQLSQEDIAKACFVSLSSLQKVFRYALRMSVGSYIERRRITQAARALLAGKESVTDIALRFQYQSPEVFSRAFQRVFHLSPSAFRRTRRFANLFPRVSEIYQVEDETMARRKVDVSELYEVLRAMRDTVVLCFDIQGLMPINDISHEAGDIAILTAIRRIEEAMGEEMLLFRIGGDEFALATGLSDPAAADAVKARVLARNGETFAWAGQEIPLSLYAASLCISADSLRYNELFGAMHTAIKDSKQ